MNPDNIKRGWIVVASGLTINMMLGVLYAWSIFSKNLTELYHWTTFQSSLPYTVTILMFSTMMLIGGRLQNSVAPRVIGSIAGILVGVGLVVAGVFPSLAGVIFGFGILTGAGIGMAYSITTPAAVKWFPMHERGLITGIVVTGFGLAALYIAPLTNYVIIHYGLLYTFKILGICFGIMIVCAAQFLDVPDRGCDIGNIKVEVVPTRCDYSWREMLRTQQFVMLWFMFFSGSVAGLMIIGHLAKIARLQSGTDLGYLLVAAVAIANALGRPVAGYVSDRIGRITTMVGVFLVQGVTLMIFFKLNTFIQLLLGSMAVTFAYGAMTAVFPATIGDYFGLKNMGLNYAVLFTAWGIAGVIGPLLAGYILDQTGGYTTAYLVSTILCLFAAGLGWFLIGFQRNGISVANISNCWEK